jgi:hypothetical protein
LEKELVFGGEIWVYLWNPELSRSCGFLKKPKFCFFLEYFDKTCG